MALYDLRVQNRSVKLGVLLFLLMLGYGYSFAFLMVRTYAGLSPAEVQATYVPEDARAAFGAGGGGEVPLDFDALDREKHTVDRNLLIQDSHVHILMFAVIAGFLTLIILGQGWPGWFTDAMIGGAFGFGMLDFAGQWLMHAGRGGFAYLTMISGWGMSLVYLVVLISTIRILFAGRTRERSI